ncbi:MAG: DEAD/DEAH box helicase [Chloroflexi bacterium]|nr:DEAD/DEAH box helicase [Chloroflexota bacterium]
MIILHAGESKGTLVLWGEASMAPRVRPPSRRRRRSSGASASLHPFAARADGLSGALKETGLSLKPAAKRACHVTAWLPTKGDRPIPSSSLIAEPPRSRAKTKLAAWAVPAYRLSAEEAVELLCVSAGRRTLAAGVIVGPDLAYWAEALRFAGSIVARQQYLPGLTADGDEVRATWDPVFVGADAERLAGLPRRMPAVARALSEPDATAPPERPSTEALRRFVATLTDHLVRTAVSDTSPAARHRRNRPSFDSVHDSWLHALMSKDGAVVGDASDLAHLAAQVREWRRPIAVSASSPFRLCFRLEEPEDVAEIAMADDGTVDEAWYVRYLLQPHDDPSLLIPVEEAWKAGGQKLAALMRNGSNVREFLLSSLGQASGICPSITASLENARLAGYSLDAAKAHEFLTEEAIALEQAGYGVMLPAWWTRKGTKVRLAVQARAKSPKMQGGSGLHLETIVQFDWEVALGGQKLTLRELEALVRMKAPLVRVRGQWVEVSSQEIQTAIDFWEKKGTEEASVRDIIQMALGVKDAPQGFDFNGVRATGWIGKLLKQLDGQAEFKELASPRGFSGTLRPYQTRGYSWLSFLRQWGLGACLADDMGLGKTVQTLALIQRDWRAKGKRPVLLVCPTSVVNNWEKEAARFTPRLPVLVHHGPDRKRGAAFKKEAGKHAIVVSSYGLVHRDIKFLKDVPWGGVVLDEAQNIKNPETKQARAARSLEADYRVALTGTPVENNVGDLWSIMEFLNPGFLGSESEFKRKFFVPIQAERDPSAAERLKRITGPFILRRLKTDRSIISDLPEKLETKVFCSLTKEQASLYASVLKETEEALQDAEGIQRKGLILGTLSKLKQVCNHPAQLLGDNSSIAGRSGKVVRLTEMLEEVTEVGDRALVFSQFAEMGGLLQRHMQETFGLEALFLHGGVPKRQRDRMVERFQSEGGGPPIFILSLKAGGTGLNLTSANHVFHFDRWWNPAVENQATDRVFRIGQVRNVQVHKFICAGTLEEKIDEMIERKKAVAEKVVGAGEGWLTELSNDDLKDVLALSKEVAGV